MHGASSATGGPTSMGRSSRWMATAPHSSGRSSAADMLGPVLGSAPGSAVLADLRGPVACVDLETTGGAALHHRVIEVGIVLLDDGAVVDEWSSLVNPGCPIPRGITEITRIDDEM